MEKNKNMENTKRKLYYWRCFALIELAVLLMIGLLALNGTGAKPAGQTIASTPESTVQNTPETSPESTPAQPAEVLTLWREGTGVKQKLIDYVTSVTDESSADFIPVENRIAVFDMDGTLACETYFAYYDTMMFIEYCLHDHPERVSDELKAIAADIKPGYTADEALARNFAKAYAGLTVEEFYDYVVEFGKKKTASFNNMR